MDSLLFALPDAALEGERRWLISAAEALELLEQVGPALEAIPRESGAGVRTTYLDTPRHTLAGSPGGVRARIRLREYADVTGRATTAALELKVTTGGVRMKERVLLDAAEARRVRAGDVAWLGDAVSEVAPGLAAWLRRLGHELAPVAMTWYRRHALRTSDGSTRLTLDEGVRMCRPADPDAPLTPTSDLVCATLTSHVLEVKGPGPTPTALANALEVLGAPRDFSKYEASLAAVVRAGATRRQAAAGGSAARLVAAPAPR